jgi:ABC-2 type transport system permease protein
MPIHEVGYRPWNGNKTPQYSRFSIITESGIRLAAKSRWVRRLLFFAWLPVLYWGVGFFVIEQSLERQAVNFNQAMVAANMPEQAIEVAKETAEAMDAEQKLIAQTIRSRFRMIPKSDELADALEQGDEEKTRNIVWSWLLMTFFRYPQALLILFLLGSVTPGLISRDLRSRAFLLYFARPIGKIEYIVGKLLIPIAFIIFVTTLPALALYLFAILMSPDFSVIWSTWDIPIRIVGATTALVIPTASLALMLSSLTYESRFASFAWFAIWALGHGAWMAIWLATAIQMQSAPVEPEVFSSPNVQYWSMLSLYNNLGEVQSWIFGFKDFSQVSRGIVALGFITVFSLVILYRRVSAPIRV